MKYAMNRKKSETRFQACTHKTGPLLTKYYKQNLNKLTIHKEAGGFQLFSNPVFFLKHVDINTEQPKNYILNHLNYIISLTGRL